MPMKTCFICGKYTTCATVDKKWYCTKCHPKRDVYKNYSEPVEREKEIGICVYCGKSFEKYKKIKMIYCSIDCSREAGKLKQQKGRFVIFERDDFTCFYCGKKSYIDKNQLHADHIIPRKSGGKSTADNLVTACILCNLEKSRMNIRNVDDILIEIKRRNESINLLGKTFIKLATIDMIE